MIDPTAKLGVSRQTIVLGISRSSICYQPRPASDADLKLMQRIDKLHMEFPFAGSRMLQGVLVKEGFKVGPLHVATLMKCMGISRKLRRHSCTDRARLRRMPGPESRRKAAMLLRSGASRGVNHVKSTLRLAAPAASFVTM